MTQPSQRLPLLGGPLSFEGAVSLEEREGGAVLPWRLPLEERAFFEPSVANKASMPAGPR